MMFNFFKLNLFKATLTPELRSVIAQQDQETMMIKKMYQVAITAQREGKGKGTATMREICDEESLPLSIDEEPGPKQTNQALRAIVADMPPAEGTIRPDLDSTN
jgi:hypothetical protein